MQRCTFIRNVSYLQNAGHAFSSAHYIVNIRISMGAHAVDVIYIYVCMRIQRIPGKSNSQQCESQVGHFVRNGRALALNMFFCIQHRSNLCTDAELDA